MSLKLATQEDFGILDSLLCDPELVAILILQYY